MAEKRLNDNWLGERLRTLRGHRSQKEVAETAGIDKASLCRIELGKNPHPSLVTIEKIAKSLGTTSQRLLDPAANVFFGGKEPRLPGDLREILTKIQDEIRDLQDLHRATRRIVDRLDRESRGRGRRSA